ncbi:MAG: hypothetical protein ACRD1V_04490 [Vicinamibacterales bacterium]
MNLCRQKRAWYHRGVRVSSVVVLLLVSASVAAARADPIAAARRFYNQGQFQQAIDAAHQASGSPAIAASAHVIAGRADLELYRRDGQPDELDHARTELRQVNAPFIGAQEQLELQVGFAELMYFDQRYGAAAELLQPLLDASLILTPDAHDRALDWWASALDRAAQAGSKDERTAVYTRVANRMEQELRRDPTSPTAGYWLAVAARGAGDLDRAWAAAYAAWVRAPLRPDRVASLRSDLDKLIVQAIIPERADALPPRDRRQALAAMTSEWEAFKKNW